jgi:hypothetical protein
MGDDRPPRVRRNPEARHEIPARGKRAERGSNGLAEWVDVVPLNDSVVVKPRRRRSLVWCPRNSFAIVGLLFGWGIVGSIVGWQIAGRSMVTVDAGALVTRWQMPLVSRTRRYDAGQVRHLRAAPLAWPFAGFGRMGRAAYPPWFGNPGSVQFDYGARTVRVLPGLDEAEGRMVAEWLAKRLPAGGVG